MNKIAKQVHLANARIAMHAAGAKFDPVRKAYRARTIGDAEFLAAQREYKAAEAAFDLVWGLYSENG